jgi:RsmE family RNA methyltransferase
VNLLLIEPGELAENGRVRLAGRRGRHLLRVLGAEPGRRLRAGVLGGATGSAEVLAVDGESVEVRFEPGPGPEEAGGVDLVLALPRPKALRRILRLTATMGVRRLDLVNAWRVEKSFFDSPVLEAGSIRRELVLGAEQGGTTRLPEVAVHRLLMPFLGALAEKGTDEGPRLLAHPGAPDPIEAVLEAVLGAGPRPLLDPLLALGPEGGWIDRELASFEGLGFRPVTLGRWMLTTEAAVAVALGQVALLLRR